MANEPAALSQSPSQPRGILKRPGEGKDGNISKGDLKIELSKAEEERFFNRRLPRIDELQKSGGRRQLVRRLTQWKPNEAEEEHTVTKDSSASGSETPKTPKSDNPMKRGLSSSRGSGTSGEGSRPPTPRSEPTTEAPPEQRAEEELTPSHSPERPLSRTNSGRSTDRSEGEKRRAGGCAIL